MNKLTPMLIFYLGLMIQSFTLTRTLVTSTPAYLNNKSNHNQLSRITPKSQIGLAHSSSSTRLNFLGTDGGILGVGAPEVVVVVLIGYFVLGPTELYKATKEVGKFVNNFRAVGTEATAAFTDNMESQLQLDEIRKAKNDLERAFDFRRSINYDDDDLDEDGMRGSGSASGSGSGSGSDDKAEKVSQKVSEKVSEGVEGAATAVTKKKRVVRRVKKKRVEEKEEEEAEAEAEKEGEGEMNMEENLTPSTTSGSVPDLDLDEDTDYFTKIAEDLDTSTSSPDPNPNPTDETSRFQSQMSDGWNNNILDNEKQLDPLAKIMEQMALLDEERVQNLQLLEEEFAAKNMLNEQILDRKKELLDQAVRDFE